MSEFLSWLNTAGAAFVACAVRMLVQSSVLILAIVLLDLVLRRRVRAVVRYWIWLLVLVKLVLPPSVSSPTSLLYWVGRLPQAQLIAMPERPEPVDIPPPASEISAPKAQAIPGPADSMRYQDTMSSPVAGEGAALAPAARAVGLTWQALALAAWLTVVAVMVVLLVQRALFVRGLVLQSEQVPEPMAELLERCRRQIRVRAPVHLRRTSLAASPSVCGLVAPTILMPDRMIRQLDRQQLKSVLLHELAHIQRGDLWMNLAQTLLQIVYVYHPLVWLANAIIRKVREQAVDETVLAAMGDEAEDYPRTLLSIPKLAFDRPALSLRLVGVVESKKALTARIRHIVNRPFPRSAKLGFIGLALVLVLAVVLLPMAKNKHRARALNDETARSAFSVTLSNGISVELAGVCKYPVTNEPWWHPDGTLLNDRGFETPQVPEGKDYTRTFAIKLTGRPLRDVHLAWELSSHQSGFYPVYDDRQSRTLRSAQAIVARLDEDIESAELKIGIAAGNWRFAAGGALADRGASTNDSMVDKEVIWPEPTWTNGSVRVQAAHLLGRDYDCRIVAHGRDGRVHEPQTCTNTGGTDMRLCQAEFDLAKDQVKQFELQARPYEWVEFKGIRLMPERHENAGAANQSLTQKETQMAISDSQAPPAPVGTVVDERGTPVRGARVLLPAEGRLPAGRARAGRLR